MPLVKKHKFTAAYPLLIPDWTQAENDGSIGVATKTAVTTAVDVIQVNTFIGDGKFGKTSGDFDSYTVQVQNNLVIDIDAKILGSTLNAAVEVYDSAGTMIASNDDEAGIGIDPYLNLGGLSGTYTVIVRGTDSFQINPFSAKSGTGPGSTGAYRLLINNHSQIPGNPEISHGNANANSLSGGNLNDILVGNGGQDTVDGKGGNDLLIWNSGDDDDNFIGGDGNDMLEVNLDTNFETVDIFHLGATAIIGMTNTVDGDAVLLAGEVEFVDLRTFSGDDMVTVEDLTGTALLGPIRIFAGAGNDTIDGSTAVNNLTINGGTGKDMMTGGNGNDTFDFDLKTDSRKGGARDVITNFDRADDRIDLSDIDAVPGAGNQKFHWIAKSAFHHNKGELHYVKHGANLFVEGDTNGDGRADFQIKVEGLAKLTAGDFDL